MVLPGPDPDNYPPINPDDPVPDDLGELSPWWPRRAIALMTQASYHRTLLRRCLLPQPRPFQVRTIQRAFLPESNLSAAIPDDWQAWSVLGAGGRPIGWPSARWSAARWRRRPRTSAARRGASR